MRNKEFVLWKLSLWYKKTKKVVLNWWREIESDDVKIEEQ